MIVDRGSRIADLTAMKRLFMFCLVLCAFCLLPSLLFAAELRFAWDPSEQDIAGYRIHYGKETGVYTEAVDVGKPATVDGRVAASITVPYGNKYFSCTAYAADGVESAYSNEVMAVTPPDKPVNFNVVSASVTYYFAPK